MMVGAGKNTVKHIKLELIQRNGALTTILLTQARVFVYCEDRLSVQQAYKDPSDGTGSAPWLHVYLTTVDLGVVLGKGILSANPCSMLQKASQSS
jgi:hypothetical protein